jgi:cytoskeletal protein RodZ
MSEENEAGWQAKEETGPERVGDVLRRERIARRIALETIAKDLKLNVQYVRSLEANDYNNLPADPYIRVYLRSLAKYLLLDPEVVLKKFYDDRGIHDENFRKGSDTQIVITMAKTPGKKEVKPWMIIVGVIVVLGIVSFFANRKTGMPGAQGNAPHAIPSAAPVRPDSAKPTVHKAAPTDATEDSLIGKMVRHDTAVAAPAPVAAPATATTAAPDTGVPAAIAVDSISMGRGILSLEIKAKKDSVWLQIFSDGVSWKNWLKENQTKRCVARDSFNVCVGNNSLLAYTFNGKTFRIEARDVAIFKIARGMKKPEIWTLAKWNAKFKSRT